MDEPIFGSLNTHEDPVGVLGGVTKLKQRCLSIICQLYPWDAECIACTLSPILVRTLK